MLAEPLAGSAVYTFSVFIRLLTVCAAVLLSMTLALAAQKPAPKPAPKPAAQPAPKHEGVHRHPAAAKRKNPVPANAESPITTRDS